MFSLQGLNNYFLDRLISSLFAIITKQPALIIICITNDVLGYGLFETIIIPFAHKYGFKWSWKMLKMILIRYFVNNNEKEILFNWILILKKQIAYNLISCSVFKHLLRFLKIIKASNLAYFTYSLSLRNCCVNK